MENLFFDLNKLKYLGEGAIIGKCVRIRRPELCVIGDYTIIDDFTYISCILETGSYCHIGANVNISGGQQRLKIGNLVGISSGCSIHVASSDYVNASLDLPSVPVEYHFGSFSEEILMENHVLLGAHSVVLPGVYLPEGFASAAQTIIRRRTYEPWTLYGGHDCRKLVIRDHQLLDTTIRQLKREKNE